jgi:uncharacterized membrane protein
MISPADDSRRPRGGTVLGVLALIAAILAVIIPVYRVLYFSPIAALLGIGALWQGGRGYGIAVIVLLAVNMIVSPTFWLNLATGSQMSAASGSRLITYLNIFGVLIMLGLLLRRSRSTAPRDD